MLVVRSRAQRASGPCPQKEFCNQLSPIVFQKNFLENYKGVLFFDGGKDYPLCKYSLNPVISVNIYPLEVGSGGKMKNLPIAALIISVFAYICIGVIAADCRIEIEEGGFSGKEVLHYYKMED